MVNKELCCSGVWILCASHRDSAAVIRQAIVCFIFDWVLGAFLYHLVVEAATLDHKVRDYSVKYGAVIETISDIVKKILGSYRCFFCIEFDDDVAERGF